MKLFNSIQLGKPKLNKFDLSHEKKLTLSLGKLAPILVQDILPGDKFKVNTEVLLRMQPLLAPIYARLRIQVDYFFVPNRLVWDNWEKFITGGENGTYTASFPRFIVGDADKAFLAESTLADYMGLPTIDQIISVSNSIKFSALPFRAYQLIYNEYYRDQNLGQAVTIDTAADGFQTVAQMNECLAIRQRAWEKDYLTSCLPNSQKGGAVILPNDPLYKNQTVIIDSLTGLPATPGEGLEYSNSGVLQNDLNNKNLRVDNLDGIDISIESLRRSARLQEWLERNMRAGSRYVESLKAHFGVHNDDLRVMRPQYLGGWQNPVVISEVLSNFQFSGDAEGEPQGHMAGHGIGVGNGSGFTGKFKEHGYVIGIMSVLPRTSYQQGLERHWSKTDKLDWAWPSFAQIGEQAVYDNEAYFDFLGADGAGYETFGYQSRYAEYKFKQSTVHGNFRSSLAYWHAGRIFASKPALNEQFIKSDPTTRFFAVEQAGNTDPLLINLYNRVDALRPLPYFNTPTL